MSATKEMSTFFDIRKFCVKLFKKYLTDTGLEKMFVKGLCVPFVEISLRASFYFFEINSSARIRMALKAPHSPVSVN